MTPRRFFRSRPPSTRISSMPSVRGVWIFSGITHYEDGFKGFRQKLVPEKEQLGWPNRVQTPKNLKSFCMQSNSRNIIYMVECRRCNKQYIGRTKRQLKERFNEHHRPVDKQVHPNNSKLTAVSEHFFLPNHSASDMQLIRLSL